MKDLFSPKLAARCSMVPRDYQQHAIDETFRLWAEGHVGALCRLPTGAGKTLTGAMIADIWLQKSEDNRVLILAHERQLIDQFAQEVEEILHIRPAIEMGSIHCTGREKIIVGSRQTLYVKRGEDDQDRSRLFKFRHELNWLVICDESHRWTRHMSSCREIVSWFEQNPNHRRLGLTATPERTDKILFTGLFTGVASDYRLHDVDGGPSATGDGWAVPYDQRYIVVEGVDFKNIPEIAKDFNQHALEEILGEQETLARLCDPLLELAGRRKTLIFSVTTTMAKNVAQYINAKLGQEVAKTINGGDADQLRKNIYRQHQAGEFQFLSVCGLCREGYNDPDIQAIAIFRPTKSRSLAEQMKGRGCRPMRGTVSSEMTPDERRAAILCSAKPTCMVIDLVGATGLGDVPSTVDIIADGKPDDVIELAKQKLLDQSPDEVGDVVAAIRDAEKEIAEKKAEARKLALQVSQAEADRRAAIKLKVNYTERAVRSGQVGTGHRGKRHPNPPSDAMCKFLWVLGVDNPQSLSMNQGRHELARRSNAHGGNYIVRGGVNRGKQLKDLPHEWLRSEGKRRSSDNDFDREFQRNLAEYRQQFLRENQQ